MDKQQLVSYWGLKKSRVIMHSLIFTIDIEKKVFLLLRIYILLLCVFLLPLICVSFLILYCVFFFPFIYVVSFLFHIVYFTPQIQNWVFLILHCVIDFSSFLFFKIVSYCFFFHFFFSKYLCFFVVIIISSSYSLFVSIIFFFTYLCVFIFTQEPVESSEQNRNGEASRKEERFKPGG